jgi:hypothetical protein
MPRWGFVNRMMCAVFSSERHVLKYMAFPFGVSVIALCARPDNK